MRYRKRHQSGMSLTITVEYVLDTSSNHILYCVNAISIEMSLWTRQPDKINQTLISNVCVEDSVSAISLAVLVILEINAFLVVFLRGLLLTTYKLLALTGAKFP
jgi:hypothetical protein